MSDYLQLQMTGLALRAVPSKNSTVRLKAATWHNLLHRLGVHLPYVIVHDFGQIFCIARGDMGEIGPDLEALKNIGTHPDFQETINAYCQLMEQLSNSEVVHRARGWRLGDDVIAVLLAKVLMVAYRDWPEARKKAFLHEQLPMDGGAYEHSHLRGSLDANDWKYFYTFFNTLLSCSMQVRHAVEQIDLDTLRLLAMFGGTEISHNPLELVDLMGLFTVPMVNDIVNFSLQILPSVLETKKLKDAQTFSMDGFSGIERVGNLDNLILTEFAYDNEIFTQKFIDNELYYYGRDRAREEEQKLHYLLVDASASMRGRRTVFARGVALAMLKKLILQKEQPVFRFFDSRLYESVRVGVDAHSVPYLLSFKSERGRNYRKVFEQVMYEVKRLKERERKEVILYFFTHGQCHLPDDLVLRLKELVFLFGIYILPGERLDLSYISHLNMHQVVNEDSLGNTQQRAGAAKSILNRVGQQPGKA